VFEKNANYFDENLPKSQKIMIITSTPAKSSFHKKLSKIPENCDHNIDKNSVFVETKIAENCDHM
jgi:hypothetical protein